MSYAEETHDPKPSRESYDMILSALCALKDLREELLLKDDIFFKHEIKEFLNKEYNGSLKRHGTHDEYTLSLVKLHECIKDALEDIGKQKLHELKKEDLSVLKGHIQDFFGDVIGGYEKELDSDYDPYFDEER